MGRAGGGAAVFDERIRRAVTLTSPSAKADGEAAPHPLTNPRSTFASVLSTSRSISTRRGSANISQ